jgi:hypothetical protein
LEEDLNLYIRLWYGRYIENCSIDSNAICAVNNAVFSYTANNDINRQAIAQQTTQKIPVPPETAAKFADLIILNDTNIGSLNDTLLNSIGINNREDCMRVPNSIVLYCP